MPSIHIDGIRHSYEEAGDVSAPALILLHGFPFTSALWWAQVESLSDRYQVIAPDLRGFGGSDLGSQDYTIASLADDVAALLDSLGLTEDRPTVIAGLSMGGYVAFEFYRRHSTRVAALLLADTRPHPDDQQARANRKKMAELARSEGSRAVAEQLLPKLLAAGTRQHRPEIERVLRRMMESVPPDTIAAALMAMAERADSRPLLPKIQVPVLVLAGAEDVITPPSEASEWVKDLPRGRLETIDAAGHVSNLERPEVFNTLLLDFLANQVAT